MGSDYSAASFLPSVSCSIHFLLTVLSCSWVPTAALSCHLWAPEARGFAEKTVLGNVWEDARYSWEI